MAQLVARLVRNEKVGGSNPPSSTTGRHSIRMSAFCMPGRCCGACCCVALAPLVFRAPRVLCWAGLLGVPVGGGPPASRPRCELRSARRLEARPGPAAAHGHRSLAPPARTGTASRLCHRPRAPQPDLPVPSTPVAPGVLMVLCVGSKPGQALPPPMGTAARPSGPCGALHRGGAWYIQQFRT